MKNILAMICIALSVNVYSSQATLTPQQALTDGKSFALSRTQSVKDSTQTLDIQGVDAGLGNDGSVPQTQYYNSGLDVEHEAHQESQNNTTATYLHDARDKRPELSIDRQNDPLFENYDQVTSMSHQLTDTYSGCVSLPKGKDTYQTGHYTVETCGISGQQNTVSFNCNKKIEVTCSNPDAGQHLPHTATVGPIPNEDYQGNNIRIVEHQNVNDNHEDTMTLRYEGGDIFTYGSLQNNRSGSCKDYNNTVFVHINDVSLIDEFIITHVQYDDWMKVSVNSDLGFRGIGGGIVQVGFGVAQSGGTHTCEKGAIRRFNINLDIKAKLHNGWNRIEVYNQVGGNGSAWMKMRVVQKKGCNEVQSEVHTCDPNESYNRGTLINSTCIDNTAVRVIDGVNVSRPCWEWNESYERLGSPIYTKSPQCLQLEAQGCGQNSSECTNNAGTYCVSQVATYHCPTSSAVQSTETVDLCAASLACQNGDCMDDVGRDQHDATEEFKKAATGMAVASEIAEHIDRDNLTVFSGEEKSCKRVTGNYSNCCKESGWGQSLDIAGCSSNEETLRIAQEAGRAVYVGRECDSSNFFGCWKYKYVNCVYPSKLARIVIQQSKQQIGSNFGSANNPNCAGLTIPQLESLDFEQLDLSEFHEDVANSAAGADSPNQAEATQQILDRLSDRLPQSQSQE